MCGKLAVLLDGDISLGVLESSDKSTLFIFETESWVGVVRLPGDLARGYAFMTSTKPQTRDQLYVRMVRIRGVNVEPCEAPEETAWLLILFANISGLR